MRPADIDAGPGNFNDLNGGPATVGREKTKDWPAGSNGERGAKTSKNDGQKKPPLVRRKGVVHYESS
jgi:hypothetical protein